MAGEAFRVLWFWHSMFGLLKAESRLFILIMVMKRKKYLGLVGCLCGDGQYILEVLILCGGCLVDN